MLLILYIHIHMCTYCIYVWACTSSPPKIIVYMCTEACTYMCIYSCVYIYVCMYVLCIMATHSSVLAWEIPWTEEPSRLQSMGHRVRHDWVQITCVCKCVYMLNMYMYVYIHIVSSKGDTYIYMCIGMFMCMYPCIYVPVYTVYIEEGNGTPLQYSCLESLMGGGAW